MPFLDVLYIFTGGVIAGLALVAALVLAIQERLPNRKLHNELGERQ